MMLRMPTSISRTAANTARPVPLTLSMAHFLSIEEREGTQPCERYVERGRAMRSQHRFTQMKANRHSRRLGPRCIEAAIPVHLGEPTAGARTRSLPDLASACDRACDRA